MKFYISIGDVNGIGAEIALLSHSNLQAAYHGATLCYGIDMPLLKDIQHKLTNDTPLPTTELASLDLRPLFEKNFPNHSLYSSFESVLAPIPIPTIRPGCVCADSGLYACKSFLYGILLAQSKKIDALITLPINKLAWNKAGICYIGHTEILRALYNVDVIMMLGCSQMLVALYTDHIPLAAVAQRIQKEPLAAFLINLANSHLSIQHCAVLGLNPHAGDGGVIGCDEHEIIKAIDYANQRLGKNVFAGPFAPDSAFIPCMREQFQYFVAMYHDQGLIPLKTLYFDQSIQISLNLPIIRLSVDHGTAFDIAYQNKNPSLDSYKNACLMAYSLTQKGA